MSFGSVIQLLTSGLITFVLGGIAGAFIMGLYLLVSIRFLGTAFDRGVFEPAHPGLQAMAAPANRRERRPHDLRDRDRQRAAPLARGEAEG